MRADLFLEEPGTTAIANLIDTALPDILAGLRTGDPVDLKLNKESVTVISTNGQRIGQIDENLAKTLETSLKAGSKFDAFIKSVSFRREHNKAITKVEIFIREVSRSPKLSSKPFHVDSDNFTPYIREEALTLLANQAPVQTESEDGVEEVEVASLPSAEREHNEESFEDLVEKEAQEDYDES
jgi:hypothetical protein